MCKVVQRLVDRRDRSRHKAAARFDGPGCCLALPGPAELAIALARRPPDAVISPATEERWLICAGHLEDGTMLMIDGTRRLAVTCS
jgi:hypothetical protein